MRCPSDGYSTLVRDVRGPTAVTLPVEKALRGAIDVASPGATSVLVLADTSSFMPVRRSTTRASASCHHGRLPPLRGASTPFNLVTMQLPLQPRVLISTPR